MDRQVIARLIVLASILVLAGLAFAGAASPIAQAALLVPIAFAVGGAIVLGLPYLAIEKSEGHRIQWKKALDFIEHGTVLAWVELFVLWCTGFIAFMGLTAATVAPFAAAAAIGLGAAMWNLALSEMPDSMQGWQHHPQ